MWQRFTEQARHTVAYAQEEAAKMGTYHVDTEHMLLGLLRNEQGSAFQLLQQLGVHAGNIKSAAGQQGLRRQQELWTAQGNVWPPPPRTEGYPYQAPPEGETNTVPELKSTQEMTLTKAGKHVIDFAYDEARQLSNGNIGPEHLLLGMMREGKGIAAQVLQAGGVDLDRARQAASAMATDAQSKPSGGWLKTLFGRK